MKIDDQFNPDFLNNKWDDNPEACIFETMTRIERGPDLVFEELIFEREGHDTFYVYKKQDSDSTTGKKMLGVVRKFPLIPAPLVRWVDPDYCTRPFDVVSDDGRSKLDLVVCLTSHLMPGLEFQGDQATPDLHDFIIYPMLSQFMGDGTYALKPKAVPFFQGGYGAREDKWFLIEFWRHKGIHAWVRYFCDHWAPSNV